MAFFKGQETYSIDTKGRVAIPAKMRKSLSPQAKETFVVTQGSDKCVYAYPLDQWAKYEKKFEDLNQFDQQQRYFLRSILMWSEESVLDSQQRVTIPKKLMEYAAIENKVCIVGMVDHIEFWNPEQFEQYINNNQESYDEIAEKVMASR